MRSANIQTYICSFFFFKLRSYISLLKNKIFMSQKYISIKNKINFRQGSDMSVIHEIANFIKQNCKLAKIKLKSDNLKCARERP